MNLDNDDSAWRKSSHSDSGSGTCVEVRGSWRKSTFSAAGNCVEAGNRPGRVSVRDTQEAVLGERRTVLEFSPAAWSGFLRGLA